MADARQARTPAEIDQGPSARYTRRFYRDVLAHLNEADVPVLVGGAFAFSYFTGIQRPTKDFDIFLRREHVTRALEVLASAGFATELTFPHWLGKARSDEFIVDLIFSSGNGVAPVDDAWFDHAIATDVVGVPVRLCPAEELIWSKAFVMERERYDGADVVHLLRTRARALDWERIVRRFGEHWRILLVNLVLFGYVYPGDPAAWPEWVMRRLLAQLEEENATPPAGVRVCRGTLLSREQYLADIREWGYHDARLPPLGSMSAQEIASWTAAIEGAR